MLLPPTRRSAPLPKSSRDRSNARHAARPAKRPSLTGHGKPTLCPAVTPRGQGRQLWAAPVCRHARDVWTNRRLYTCRQKSRRKLMNTAEDRTPTYVSQYRHAHRTSSLKRDRQERVTDWSYEEGLCLQFADGLARSQPRRMNRRQRSPPVPAIYGGWPAVVPVRLLVYVSGEAASCQAVSDKTLMWQTAALVKLFMSRAVG